MQLAHHVADDARALDVPAVGPQSHLRHLEQDPPLHGLESVRASEGAGVDDRVRVLQEGALHLAREIDVPDAPSIGSGGVVRGMGFLR
jgi:hypothetical protein